MTKPTEEQIKAPCPDPFEMVMSDLNLAIGYVERLESLSSEQKDRLIQTEARLRLAVSALVNEKREAA